MCIDLPTHFAPAEKEDEAELARQLEVLVADPLVDRLLDAFPEPTMVLNSRHRSSGQTNKPDGCWEGRRSDCWE